MITLTLPCCLAPVPPPPQVVPLDKLEEETLVWCREMLRNSPTALRVLKAALNAAEDGQAGIQELGGNATLLFYMSEEGNEVGWDGVGCSISGSHRVLARLHAEHMSEKGNRVRDGVGLHCWFCM